MTEPMRRRAGGCSIGSATNGLCSLRSGVRGGCLMPSLCARPLRLSRRMNRSPRLEKQQVKHKQMDSATLRKVSQCGRLRAQAAGVGVSVLSQLRLCQALARACASNARVCCLNLLRSRKGLIFCSFQRTGGGTQLGQPSPPARSGRGTCRVAESPLETSAGKSPLARVEVSLCLQALL